MNLVRRAFLVAAVGCLLGAVALLVRLSGVERRALETTDRDADAFAARAAGAVGSLLVFHDADGAIETVKDMDPDRRLVSIVVLNQAGLASAIWQAPAAGETHVARVAVIFEGRRVGTVVIGTALTGARDLAGRQRLSLLLFLLALTAIGLACAGFSVVGPLRKRLAADAAERKRVADEHAVLKEEAAEMEALLERERKDRRFVEGALSGRDLLERDRRVILEKIARGEPLREILREVAALVEHQRPQALCAISPLRQGVRSVGATGSASPFGTTHEDVPLGSTTPPLLRAVEERRLVVTRNVADDPMWLECRADFEPHGIGACWAAPIETGAGVVLGTLSVLLPDARRPSGPDAALLSGAASLAAIAIEQRQFSEQLAFQARFDWLTSLPNRLSFEASLQEAFSRASVSGERILLVSIDLDRFKQVNDTFGYAGGDELLREVAFRLSSALNEGDFLARVGGDEFCAIRVESQGRETPGIELSERLLETLKGSFDLRGDEVFVGASVGVSVYPDDAKDVVALQRHADAAMHAAKGQAGNGYRVFGPGVAVGGGDRLRLENDLHRALARGELETLLQPQADCDGDIVGAEALLRWNHPELGLIQPNRFIPIAEESGLILSIGLWVFEDVCRRFADWRRAGIRVVPISVNLSSLQFSQTDLVEALERILLAHDIPAWLVRLELTESLLVKDIASTMTLLGRLKALGLGLAVDDFGTGYSSLSYLQVLPIDELKIDQAFLRALPSPIDTGSRTARLMQTMITLGHGLGLVVVAEGVESREQIDFLRKAGCDRLQGFGVSAPLTVAAFTDLLLTTRGRDRQAS
jgi:diguanylate cyclase (GGDEF)-like protein